jgi:hypothetical protein
VSASAPRGISQVVFKIDGNTIAINYAPPFELDYYLKTAAKGQHTITVIASDDIGNSSLVDVPFDLQAEMDAPDFSWVDAPTLRMRNDDFPRSISAIPFRWADIKDIKITLIGNGQNKLIYTFDHNDQLLVDKLNFTWKNSPGPGTYTLIGLMTDNNNRTATKSLEVIVE